MNIVLNHAKISNINFSGANLSGAELIAVDFSGALGSLSFDINPDSNLGSMDDPFKLDISPTIIRRYSIYEYIFQFMGAMKGINIFNLLSFANFSDANLTGANLSKSLLINMKSLKALMLNQKTKFDDSLTDMPELIEYIRKNRILNSAPKLIQNREELRKELLLRYDSEDHIRRIVESSRIAN